MNFKLTRSDIYLSCIFFTLAVFIGSMDYSDYPDHEKYLLWIDHLNFILFTSVTVYVLVYIIFAKFFPTGRFFSLFFWGVLFLFFMGELTLQWNCAFRNCSGNLFSLNGLYIGFQMLIENIGIFATFLLGKKLYDAQVHLVNIEKEKKESELRFLKSQIDPHFLFNNLNTIDSLIDTNPQSAKTYLNKLSHLYRYLISSKDFEVVPLEDELNFAKNYMFLIESRFGDAFHFEIKNEMTNSENHLIPPGALQTLLENIVKHNHGSSTLPIKTTVQITDDYITVSNNIKKKLTPVDSTGIGLNNLKSRYQLLTDTDIQIQSDNNFTVQLPTIKQVA